jgi:hypothetical protein
MTRERATRACVDARTPFLRQRREALPAGR